MNDDKAKAYKKNYSIIFSSFYLVQGLHNGIWGTVLAFYLEFENYLIKWVKFASPSYEEVYFVKKIKELLE